MRLAFLRHYLSPSGDIEATKDWYVSVLRMPVGPSPDFKFFRGDCNVLHLTPGGHKVSGKGRDTLGKNPRRRRGRGH
ncbi:MAG: hypothetical protein J2P54_18295 [Bradyrhizobiaceae bacterium]|nr:hypothetical protein [Bradyrhizobiaceae bacterium]